MRPTLAQREQIFLTKLAKNRPTITVLTKYLGSNRLLTVTDSQCGHTWDITPNNLRINIGCKKCFHARLKKRLTHTHEEFLTKINNINLNYVPKEPYVNASTVMKFVCTEHNVLFSCRVNQLKSTTCPRCKKIAKIAKIAKQINDTKVYRYIDGYVDYKTHITYQCLKCDNINTNKVHTLLNTTNACPYCVNGSQIQQFNTIIAQFDGHITLCDDSVLSDQLIELQCNNTNKIWETTIENFIKSPNCYFCK